MKISIIRQVLALLIALCWVTTTSANVVVREADESVEKFVSRYAPVGSEITHQIIDSSEWLQNHKVLIVFFEHPYPSPNDDTSMYGKVVTGVLFISLSPQKYEKKVIGDFQPEGANAQINSVFFAQVDKTTDKKLFVMVSWSGHHGTLYKTYIYQPPRLGEDALNLVPMEDLSKTFDMECDYCPESDDPDRPAKFKTASDVKKELKKLVK